MEPFLKNVETFTVVGISARTSNQAETDPTKAQIPGLWQRFFAEGISEQIKNVNGSAIYGVYSDYESDANGAYTLTIGLQVSEAAKTQEALTVKVIQSGQYLVFPGGGAMPQAVIDTWGKIWNHFTSDQKLRRSFTTDFELYTGPDSFEIHIAVDNI